VDLYKFELTNLEHRVDAAIAAVVAGVESEAAD
jgi:hypothetical protein